MKNIPDKTKHFMEPNMHLQDRPLLSQWPQIAAIFLCVVMLAGSFLMAESETGSGVLRSRVYSLKNISSQQAEDFFTTLNIGKSYNKLTPDVLIITSNVDSDLIIATEIVGLLDRSPAPQIQILMTATEDQPLGELESFVTTLEDMVVGTLTDAPPKEVPNPAIVDIRGDQLIAIATEEVSAQIQTAFEMWQQENQPVSVNEPAEAELPALPAEPIAADLAKSIEADQPEEPVETPEETEPNIPGLIPEPNELQEAQSQKQEAAEPNEPAGPALLEEIASEFTESQPLTVDEDESTAEPVIEDSPVAAEPNQVPQTSEQPEALEDFFSEGLIAELTEAEQGSKPIVESSAEQISEHKEETVVADQAGSSGEAVDQEQPEQAVEQDDPMKIMQALLAQARAEEEAAQAARQAQADTESQPTIETAKLEETDDTTQTDLQVEESNEKLEAELAALRQKIAELEAETAKEEAPVEAAVESKIQTTQVVETEPTLDPTLADKELETVIDLPQEVELESLVDLVGKQLGLNYMYDPAILRNQKVQLKLHGGKIKVKDTYALLESVLRFKGFVMTRRDELVTILRQQDLAKAEPVLRAPDEPIQPGDIVVSSVFELENISAASAQNMLKGMNLGTNFTPINETNTLIVTDFAYRMERVRQVLDMIDVQGEKKEYQFRTLKYMEPSEMVPKLQDLAKKLEGVSLQISSSAQPAQKTRTVTSRDPKTGRTTTRQVPVSTSTPAAQQQAGSGGDAVLIDTDDRTNRILMAGKPDQLILINELIDALDVPQYDLKFVREYIIENVEAVEVVDVINELALASVSVSAASKTKATTPTRTTAAQARTPQQRTSTPTQAASSKAGGGDQPNISIRSATNSLLVNATAEQHKAIELVIAHVDVVQKDQRTIRQYEIQYVDTQEIIDTLTDLGIIAPNTATTGTSRSTSLRSSQTSRQTTARSGQSQQAAATGAAQVSLPTVGGGSEKEITAEQPQISVLETTNSLLVYATPRQHDAIALVIAHADRQLDTTSTPYVIYPLENQKPDELAGTLEKLIKETVEEAGQSSTPESKIQRSGTASNTAVLPTLEEQKIRVIPDEKSYSLIVYANKRNQQWISELIKQLDRYRPQVLLDVTLVEITKTDQFEFDLDLVSKASGFTPGGTMESGGLVGALLSPFPSDEILEASSSAGQVTAFYADDNIQALLTAIQTKNYGRVLAHPKLLVNDNEPGEISTTDTTYVSRQVSQNIGSENPVTTQETIFENYDAGITLTITPHISSSAKNLLLEIGLVRSDFGTISGDKPPDTANNQISTNVTVPNNATIILGGMERTNQSKGGTKVPLLGDIPLLGGLFRSTTNADIQKKLYVFVKANITRPGEVEGQEDLVKVSNKNRIQFEKMEKEMQGYEDWPGIKSTPMEPIHILEEDDFEAESIE